MLIITKQPHHGHVHCNGACITAAVAVSDARQTAFTLSVYHQSTHVEIHNRHRRYILPHSSCAFIPFRAYRNHLPNPNRQCADWRQHRSHPLRALANHHCLHITRALDRRITAPFQKIKFSPHNHQEASAPPALPHFLQLRCLFIIHFFVKINRGNKSLFSNFAPAKIKKYD